MKIVKSSLAVFVLLVVAGCCTVKPPLNPKTSEKDRDLATKIAADLNDPKVQAELSVNYKSSVKETFQVLSDKNMALYLWLKAAECESRRGHLDPARQIYEFAMETYKLASVGTPKLLSLDPRDYQEVEYLHRQLLATMEALK